MVCLTICSEISEKNLTLNFWAYTTMSCVFPGLMYHSFQEQWGRLKVRTMGMGGWVYHAQPSCLVPTEHSRLMKHLLHYDSDWNISEGRTCALATLYESPGQVWVRQVAWLPGRWLFCGWHRQSSSIHPPRTWWPFYKEQQRHTMGQNALGFWLPCWFLMYHSIPSKEMGSLWDF